MSSGKLGVRNLTELCADCGSLDPGWAVVNRGLLVCDECCSVHRSLGRHISQVKSLKRAHWPPTLLSMVHTLNNGGINSMWEALLSESKIIKRKPQPKDPVHGREATTIQSLKADWQQKELHGRYYGLLCSDQTDKEQSTRWLTVGNLFPETEGFVLAIQDQEKGSRPLHVAAREGQISQVELLIVCGADPSALDKQGNTPEACARLSGHLDVSQRLCWCLYEVPDRLTYFLCRRRPDHSSLSQQHFIVPDPADCIEPPHHTANEARFKLQQLTNPLFQDLAMDVYDEVDRRETETLWQSIPASLQLGSVPFLPVNPDLSSMRNQGRQKLARFNPREFASLVIDILADSKRRQSPFPESIHCRHLKDNSDDEPLYDSVASDDDYASPEQIAALVAANASGKPMPTMSTSSICSSEVATEQTSSSSATSPQHAAIRRSSAHAPTVTSQLAHAQTSRSSAAQSVTSQLAQAQVTGVEDELRTQLAASQKMITDLTAQIQRLQTKVAANASGKPMPTMSTSSICSSEVATEQTSSSSATSPQHAAIRRSSAHAPTVTSQLAHAQTSRSSAAQSVTSQLAQAQVTGVEDELRTQLVASQKMITDLTAQIQRLQTKVDEVTQENRELRSAVQQNSETETEPVLDVTRTGVPPRPVSMYETRESLRAQSNAVGPMPQSEEVIRRTEQVTKRIQELWSTMQSPDSRHTFVPCAERIRVAVAELTAIFPQKPIDEVVRNALRQLNTSTVRLQAECANLESSSERVRTCAYNMAKANRQLLTRFQDPRQRT
ncbi:ARF GTPase-activating protein GIT2 [Nilaparvata lugens]|uniref:ARF GTPase-activating protein GIT2 n=1 Tax=Nilaparvata lugens TaxID=108931 RepID=UPI00193CCAA0|nr:ARF GTPase-activating protein GIT2 [Nilaparvata lugens]